MITKSPDDTPCVLCLHNFEQEVAGRVARRYRLQTWPGALLAANPGLPVEREAVDLDWSAGIFDSSLFLCVSVCIYEKSN